MNIWNQILEVLVTAGVGVLVAIIPILGKLAITYITNKINEVQAKIDINKYNHQIEVAFNVWKLVDEYFRITPAIEKTIENKTKMFESELLKKFPTLTQDDIDHLRQSVAGVVNEGKEAIKQAIDD